MLIRQQKRPSFISCTCRRLTCCALAKIIPSGKSSFRIRWVLFLGKLTGVRIVREMPALILWPFYSLELILIICHLYYPFHIPLTFASYFCWCRWLPHRRVNWILTLEESELLITTFLGWGSCTCPFFVKIEQGSSKSQASGFSGGHHVLPSHLCKTAAISHIISVTQILLIFPMSRSPLV